jgi:hypothetical protein
MIQQVLTGVVLGIVFGLYGYATKAPRDEPINPRKLFRTTVVYGTAGLLVGLSGGPVTEQAVVEQTALTAVLGEMADKAYAKVKRSLNEDGA